MNDEPDFDIPETGVIQSYDVKLHVPQGYEFLGGWEWRTIRSCSCGDRFEFRGKYHQGADATALELHKHIFLANQEFYENEKGPGD